MTDPTRRRPPGTEDFDHDYLDHYTSGDVPLQREVLQLFFGQIEKLVEDLKPSGGPEDWGSIAHAIKGSARGVGLLRIGDLCEQMEQQSVADLDARKAAVSQLREALSVSKVRVASRYEGIFET